MNLFTNKSFNVILCFFFSLSVTKFIRIGIADKNDNPPYFDKALYEAEVDENEDIQHTVLTVTAKDHDECKYYIIYASIDSDIKNIFKHSLFSVSYLWHLFGFYSSKIIWSRWFCR